MSHAIQGIFATVNLSGRIFAGRSSRDELGLIRGTNIHSWWGEAPERRYDLTEGAGLLSPSIWLHQYARRAAAYCVNKGKLCCGGLASDHLWAHQDASHTADPRLDTRMGLARGLALTNVGAFD